MPKYGRGLNRELAEAVKKGEIANKLNMDVIERFAKKQGWDVPQSYINVALANGSSETHSLTYKKYFKSLGNGDYQVKKEFL